jgi:hypothetical protein
MRLSEMLSMDIKELLEEDRELEEKSLPLESKKDLNKDRDIY